MAQDGAADRSFGERRRLMVDSQIRTFDVTDPRVIAAFDTVPRERFLPDVLRGFAYSDAALTLRAPLLAGQGERVLLRPMHLARMLQGAAVKPGDRALVVAGEAGYAAALLAAMGCDVVSLESEPGLAALAEDVLRALDPAKVRAVSGPLAAGVPAGAPYDLILVQGAVETNLDGLVGQLAPGGRLVVIEASSKGPSRGTGRAVRLVHVGPEVSARSLFDAVAPILPEFRRAPAFVF